MPITDRRTTRRRSRTRTFASPLSSSVPSPAGPSYLADAILRIHQAAGSVGVASAEADALARSGGFLLGWIGMHAAPQAAVDVQIQTDADDSYLRIAVACPAASFSCPDVGVLKVLAGNGSVDLALDGDVLVGVLQRPHDG